LEGVNIKLQQGKKGFLKIIEWQFQQWQLTSSEQQVRLA
jgi:hypothetical protein